MLSLSAAHVEDVRTISKLIATATPRTHDRPPLATFALSTRTQLAVRLPMTPRVSTRAVTDLAEARRGGREQALTRLPVVASQDKVMAMVPSDVLMPDHRLEHLLRQSLRYQQDASLFPYTHSTRLSLTDDLAFDEAKLPALCAEIKYHSDEVWVCKFSPSGTWLATAGKDRTIAIWSAQALSQGDGRRVWTHASGCDGTDSLKRACICAAPAATQRPGGGPGMCERVRDALVVSIDAGMPVCSLTWSSDESILVAAGWRDNTPRAWYVPTGMRAQAIAPLRRPVCAVEWIVGHWLCAGGGGDEVILLWSITPGIAAGAGGASPDPVARLATGGRPVVSLSCSSDGKQLVALLSGQVLRFYDLERITHALAQQHWHPTPTPAQTGAAARLPGADSLEPADSFPAPAGARRDSSWPSPALDATDDDAGPGSRPLPSAVKAVRGDGTLVFDEEHLVRADQPRRQDIGGQAVEAPPDEFQYLATGPYADVRVFECFLEISEPVAGMHCLTSVVVPAPCPRDRIMLGGVGVHGEPTIVEWDVASDRAVRDFRGHRMQRFVTGFAAGGPGEALVCSGSEDGRILLWQRQSGRLAKVLLGHQGAVNTVSWCLRDGLDGSGGDADVSPAGPRTAGAAFHPYLLASGSDDYSVRIWGPSRPATTRRERNSGLRAQSPDASLSRLASPFARLAAEGADKGCEGV